jgi:hypothetical protein
MALDELALRILIAAESEAVPQFGTSEPRMLACQCFAGVEESRTRCAP